MYKSVLLRVIGLPMILSCCALAVNAQQTFFEPVASQRTTSSVGKSGPQPTVYRLQTAALRNYLAPAPLEFSNSGPAMALDIPLPDGTTETFLMTESPILSPALAAQYPEIKTYAGTGQKHGSYTIRLSFTSSGFNAIILGVGGDAVYYTKASDNPAESLYNTYFARDVKKSDATQPSGNQTNKCGTTGAVELVKPDEGRAARIGATQNNTGTSLRTFRLAIAATKEFTARRGGTVTAAYNSVIGYVNRMNAVYRVELSVAFTLISGKNIIYGGTVDDANPVASPYTNNDTGKSSDENQVNLDAVIGDANYDVGEVFGYSGGSGEGVAVAGCVCRTGAKGNGTSNMGNTSYGTGTGTVYADVYDDQLVSHEFGHQFGMSHSFHSVIPVCTTRNPSTSVEPGAGTTIMSYGFTCSDNTGNDNYENTYQPFLNFHTVNYKQAVDYLAQATVTCGTVTPTNNAVPVIGTFPANATIPRSTPFELTGAATDADGQTLSYQWEGTNIGEFIPQASTLANTIRSPFFRSYPPVSTGTRTFPRLSAILNGSNYAIGDKLPSVGFVTTHRLTVRDGVGGLTYQNATVTVDGGSGPFLVTNDPTGAYPGNSVQVATWDVANTTNAPVSCANVDILLSTDGGQTFPIVLIANTPNDGTQSVTLPAVQTTTARIKIRGSGTIFFDISNSNFSITAPLPVELVYFRAEPAVNQVRLSWATAREQNSASFMVERSQNLSEFGVIGTLAAAGESSQTRSYGLNDLQPFLGTSYYRLVQRDFDGRTQTSKPVAVVLEPTAPSLLVSPNPASGTQLRYRLLNLTNPALSLVTMSGASVAIQSVTDEGSGNYVLKSAAKLPAGVYVLRAASDSAQLTQRVLIVD